MDNRRPHNNNNQRNNNNQANSQGNRKNEINPNHNKSNNQQMKVETKIPKNVQKVITVPAAPTVNPWKVKTFVSPQDDDEVKIDNSNVNNNNNNSNGNNNNNKVNSDVQPNQRSNNNSGINYNSNNNNRNYNRNNNNRNNYNQRNQNVSNNYNNNNNNNGRNPIGKPQWKKRTADTHTQHLRYLETKGKDNTVLVLGDSMVERFFRTGMGYLRKLNNCALCGVGGDGIQHMIYRVTNGLMEATPNVNTVVIMAGTNNIQRYEAVEVYNGFLSLLELIREKKPNARIIVFGILPRDSNDLREISDDDVMERVYEYNQLLSEIPDIEYHYFGTQLLQDPSNPNSLRKDPKFYVDEVHLSSLGYKIFADAIESALSSPSS